MRRRAILLATVCIALAALALVRIGMAWRGKIRVGEARVTLALLHAAQQAHHAAHGRYAGTLGELGVRPLPGNRYAWFLAARGPVEEREGEDPPARPEAVIAGVDRQVHPEAAPLREFAATGCPLTLPRDAAGQPLALGAHGPRPDDLYLAAVAGDLDGDPELDCWSICSAPRTAAHGEAVPAGVPWRERSDLHATLWERLIGLPESELPRRR